MGEQVDARLLWGCSSVGRAPALQAGGHEFESHHLHDSIKPCKIGKTDVSQVYLSERAILYGASRDEANAEHLRVAGRFESHGLVL